MVAPKILMVLMTALLVGCETTPGTQVVYANTSPKEYDAFKALPLNERVIDSPQISWIVRDDIAEFCGRITGIKPPILGCAVWNAATRRCTIYTQSMTTHTILGHEIRHCFEGPFHGRNGKL